MSPLTGWNCQSSFIWPVKGWVATAESISIKILAFYYITYTKQASLIVLSFSFFKLLKFTKFLRTPFSQNTSGGCFWCYRKERAILKTKLNSTNRIEEINILTIPVTDLIFPKTREEGEWYNLNWATKNNYWFTQISYNNDGLDATTSSHTWQNKKSSLYK